jgi:hypothetical protein
MAMMSANALSRSRISSVCTPMDSPTLQRKVYRTRARWQEACGGRTPD